MSRALSVARVNRGNEGRSGGPVNAGTERSTWGTFRGAPAPVPLPPTVRHRDHLWGRRDARPAAVAVKGGEPLACDWRRRARDVLFLPGLSPSSGSNPPHPRRTSTLRLAGSALLWNVSFRACPRNPRRGMRLGRSSQRLRFALDLARLLLCVEVRSAAA